MTIWKRQYSPEQINRYSIGTMVEHLGIKITEVGDDYICGTMPVDKRTIQPYGILHGGASVVLAESLGSVAGNLSCDEGFMCVGLEINANHIKSVSEGIVNGKASAIHIGKTTQVWDIKITTEQKNICVSRLTLAVIPKRKENDS
ncbi:MAG: hotdog fold thioesterase [Rickettsiales bacterium]|nr:hotdog fold thioesterase [Pseudomonadota bacterium]MDA0965372.1 hotdog fold thioesterase [Pseudomonadota bacterium]MDG4544300.1 hotdog fold thioesterase [Rickettsiales bacterium]MDG4544855.1 hotdog fold thioesterase [Rickettsiales bacterium]MDG4546977.1 hotdog fold thioesterase [Rickettsiales bacterium]